jgi:hypothetical protein
VSDLAEPVQPAPPLEEAHPTAVGVATPRLGEGELRALRVIGHHWETGLAGQRWDASSLPCDPDLDEIATPSAVSRFERLSPYASFRYRGEGELEATTRGASAPAWLGRWAKPGVWCSGPPWRPPR